MQKYSDTILNRQGKPVAGAVVTVTTYPSNEPAVIYAVDGGQPVPFITSGVNGRFSFYAADGHYNLSVTGKHIDPFTITDVVLNDPSDEASLAALRAPSGASLIGYLGKTVAQALEDQSSGLIGKDTLASLNADLAYAAGAVAYVTNDVTAANNGYYRKTGAPGAGGWVKSSFDPVREVVSMGQLVRNQGANFPLKSATRDGMVSAASAELNSILLDIRVIGARAGYYYAIKYLNNGSTAVAGAKPDGWVIEEYPVGSYATAAVPRTVVSSSDDAPAIPRVGAIETVVVSSTRQDGLFFVITLDPSKLPAYGTFVRANNSGLAAWSWVIDPSCYDYQYERIKAILPADSLLINSGKAFPLRQMTRAGVTSQEEPRWSNLLLDVKVINARPGEYYQIAYQQNGANLDGEATTDWVIQAFDAATFASSGVPTVLVSYQKATYGAQQQIDRAGGVQTISLYSASRPSMRFDITLDASKLAAAGTPINSLQSSASLAWSWIIDPSRYFYEVPNASSSPAAIGVRWDYIGDSVYVSFASGANKLYRVKIGPTGYNSLPNIAQISAAPMGNIETAAWVEIASYTTDWFPPMIVQATQNGDGGAQIFTGGNHGSDGGAGGSNTARNIAFHVLPDGVPKASGTSGYCEEMRLLIVNELMAYNTITLGRYVVRQAFSVTIRAGEVNLSAEVKALEPVNVINDYGPQMVSTGFRGTQIFPGTALGRVAYDNAANSGAKSAAPKAFSIVLQEPTSGQLAMWLDRGYEHGDGRSVGDAEPLVRGGGGANHKFYCAVVRGANLPVAAGESYRWRGGYALQAPGLRAAALDSFFACHRGGNPTFFSVMPDASYMVA